METLPLSQNDSQTIYRCCITPNKLTEAPGPDSWTPGYESRGYSQKYAQGSQKRKKVVDLWSKRTQKKQEL